ncbi:MAG: undecaprenyldiphospho-muramoylpentapeptide beta-N-acetylglucosaminyltransferase [Alphaproteobacteria bacterium]
MTAPGNALVVLAAGGTAGHMYPAQALAAELASRGCGVALVTDERGSAFGPGAVDTHRIRARPIAGGPLSRLGGLADLARGTLEAARLLRRLEPAVAVGFGGYASFPTMVAAALANIPTVIHEQNAVLGRANRLLARRVTAIATSFDEVAGVRPRDRGKVVRTGTPVRPAIAALARRPYPPLDADGRLHVLVLGGSQGAGVFARVLPEAAARSPESLRARLRITQQCRPEDLDDVREAYWALGVDAELETFFDNVPQLLAEAHLVICRAGASTVAEVTAAGRPAILVPYPAAADDHQTANARAAERHGGAWLTPQQAFTGSALAARLEAFLATPEVLAEAARAAAKAAAGDAAARLAKVVLDLVPHNNGREAGHRHPAREEAA